jgi:hypothetical protein
MKRIYQEEFDDLGSDLPSYSPYDEVERLQSLLRATQVSLDNCELRIENLQRLGIKSHDGQKILVQHILDNDEGLSDNSRIILEKLIE